ncbi:MAG: hypothetical protein AB8G18_05180 [Gammaproteobacteria bacterium]
MVCRLPTLLILTISLWLFSNIAAASDTYKLEYRLDLTQAPTLATASVTVRQHNGQLRRLRFPAGSHQFLNYSSASGLKRSGDEYTWHVPAHGGTLSWRTPITHFRDDGTVDAKLGQNWALFRGEDAFPAMAAVAIKGASSTSQLVVDAPSSWSFYSALDKSASGYVVNNPHRRFDRPTGWMIAGQLGVRFDDIAGVAVSVAAPKNQDVRRQDMMALINWTLEDLTRVLGRFPKKLLVVSAADNFWRGGLSGPSSLYIHADRPLISGNGTSTLVHELFHVGFSRSAKQGNDWIVEGLAEYYSVELLRRSKTVTQDRYDKTLESLTNWGENADSLTAKESRGSSTARAVGIFKRLDEEIQQHTSGKKCLDDVVRHLVRNTGRLDIEELQAAIKSKTGVETTALNDIE